MAKCWKFNKYNESSTNKTTYENNDSKNVSNDNIKKVQVDNKPNEYSSFKFELEAKEIKNTTIYGLPQTKCGPLQNCSLNVNDNSELIVSEDVNVKDL